MKKLFISSLVLALMLSFSVQAQSRTSLKGPAAKNYKPWKDTEQPGVKAVTYATKADKKGPVAKNEKVWERTSATSGLIAVETSYNTKLKGPAAKNKKVWTSNDNTQVQVARKAKEQKETSN